jgi:hypothetical protein
MPLLGPPWIHRGVPEGVRRMFVPLVPIHSHLRPRATRRGRRHRACASTPRVLGTASDRHLGCAPKTRPDRDLNVTRHHWTPLETKELGGTTVHSPKQASAGIVWPSVRFRPAWRKGSILGVSTPAIARMAIRRSSATLLLRPAPSRSESASVQELMMWSRPVAAPASDMTRHCLQLRSYGAIGVTLPLLGSPRTRTMINRGASVFPKQHPSQLDRGGCRRVSIRL